MLESGWLFTGVVAILATGVALSTQTETVAKSGQSDGIAIMSGIAGFVSWGVWSFGTLDVTVVGDSVTYSFSLPSLTMLGVMLALVPGYIALTGPADIIARSREPNSREV